MKKTLLFLLLASVVFYGYAQKISEQCGTQAVHEKRLKTDPVYKAAFLQAQLGLSQQLSSYGKTSGTVYTIPVVVHVMHIGSAVGTGENISDAQVRSAIDALNDDYRKKPGTNGDGNGVDAEIEFCLASKDPSGNAHSGINRIDASGTSNYATNGLTTSGTDNEIAIKALSKWNNTKYYNIWVVYKIDSSNGSGTQGFAYFPGAPSSVDGAVILYNAFGTTGNLKAYTNKNRTASHEIGHGLGLYHTFQGDQNGSSCPTDADCGTNGDCIADTPPHIRSNSNCVTGTNSCTGGSTTLFIHNYMDYSSDNCQNEFTQGQKDRMRASLAGTRASLVTPANITASGCDGTNVPTALFSAATTTPCYGIAVQFTDESLYAPTGWTWSFPGGTPSSSTLQNPTVTYNTAGPYDVTLVASNTYGSSVPEVKTAYITPVTSRTLPFSENFENTTFPPTGWAITTPGYADIPWARTTNASGFASGTASAFLENDTVTGTVSPNGFITPPLDFSNAKNPVLSFSVAYERYYSNPTDSLIVYYSTDCGQTYTATSYTKGYSLLYTSKGANYTYFIPTGSQWRRESIFLSGLAGQPSVVLKFERQNRSNGASNNLYLDDVQITDTCMALPYAQDFESGAPGLSDFVTTTNPESRTQVLAAGANSSLFGLVMDGNTVNSYTTPTAATAFSLNPARYASTSVCIDATGLTNLSLSFDYKQIYQFNNNYTNFRITANGTQVGNVYQPSGATTSWSTKSVDLSAYAGGMVYIGFEANTKYTYDNGGTDIGNATYIDNINIQGSTPTGLVTSSGNGFAVHVYPNPFAGSAWISYRTDSTMPVTIEVYNSIGEKVKILVQGDKTKGSYMLALDLAEDVYKAGIYLLKFTMGNEVLTKRLLKTE